MFNRIKWRIMRAVGLGSRAWDEQFRLGIWGGDTESPRVIERVVRLARGGRIVEFGCGHGQLARSLPAGSFSSYLGVDISALAVEEAAKRAAKQGLRGCRFEQGDMLTWAGDSGVDLIVLLECLYYAKGAGLERFLDRCIESLSPEGSILVVIHSARKHRRTIDACRAGCRVVREESIGPRTYLTLAGPGAADRSPVIIPSRSGAAAALRADRP